MEYVTLTNGVRMPMIGYGVYQIPVQETRRLVAEALEAGCRLLDTAQSYRNEAGMGEAVADSGIPRSELFLTTKVWPGFYGEQATRDSVLASLEKLRTDYLDLVLLHQPYGDCFGAWRALERLYCEGAVRAIGVSNFYPDRLTDLCGFSEVPPMVNQVETHPLFQQTGAHETMRRLGVVHESWAPFGEGRGGLFDNEVIRSIGQRCGRTPAQVMLRWQLQRGIVAIPKSSSPERMRENLDVFGFELTASDMEAIGRLDTGRSVFFDHRDPKTVEWFVNEIKTRAL